jgi:hypothetical protein
MSLVSPIGRAATAAFATTAADRAERVGRLDKSAGRWMMAGCEPGGVTFLRDCRISTLDTLLLTTRSLISADRHPRTRSLLRCV